MGERPLEGRRGLVVGIANRHSVAMGCAQACADQGARLAVTYLNDKAKPHVVPCAEALGAELCMPLDVQDAAQEAALFDAIAAQWGGLDFLIHSIAFAPQTDLHGRVLDSSAAGFALAMDISCHSFLRLARRAEALMPAGGVVLTVSFYGAEKVVPGYGMMGPVKAALEASVRYAAAELAPKGIRAYALSPGPIRTRAAGGLKDLEQLLADAATQAPDHSLTTIEEVGAWAAFLVNPAAAGANGAVIAIDRGFSIMA